MLGMHRSGTSMITRALVCLGVDLGDDLLDAVAGSNERGFWEDRSIVDLNDRLLAALGSRWDGLAISPDGTGNDYLVDILQRMHQHPASRVHELTPRLWKSLFASNRLRSAVYTLRV